MPASATDRLYGLTTSVAVKPPCRIATTANITLAGLQTIGSVTLLADDRVLVKDQTDATQNGIYVANTSAWSRAPDFDGERDAVDGTIVLITENDNAAFFYKVSATNPIVIGTSAIEFLPALVPTGSFGVSAKTYGAVGDGVTNDTAAVQAAVSAAAGNTVFFPPGDYLITAAIDVPANTCVMGCGYGSRILCPGVGWLLGTTDNYGLLNVKDVNNVRITNIRLYGTKLADNANSPKLVYFENCEDLTIDHCWLENSGWEGIWSGGAAADSRRIIIANNHIDNVGHPAGGFVGLPAIQPNGYDIVIIGNELYNVGSGIGPSGVNVVIANNLIREFTVVGIGIGDGGSSGNIAITGNVIEFTAAVVARSGILLAGGSGTHECTNVSGNTIRVLGSAGLGNARGVRSSTARNFAVMNNVVEIDVRGVGIDVVGVAAGVTAHVSGNTIRISNEGGVCTGVSCNPNGGGNTLTVVSSNNRVYGATRANGSYAFDYNDGGGGTLDATCAGDFMTEGNFRIGSGVNYAAGQVDNKPIFMRNNLTGQTGYHAAPQVGMLNLTASAGSYTIAAGVITLAGTSGSLDRRRTRVTVDTEGAAATDDLDTVNGTQDGDLVILRAADSARTVVARDGTGNLRLAGNFSMDNVEDRLTLLNDGGVLYEIARSDNGA